MKKILYVCNGSSLYGSERALINLLDNMSKFDYEPVVLLPKNGMIVKELELRKVKYKVIRYYSWTIRKSNFIYYIIFLLKHFLNLISLFRIHKFISSEKFDFIHSLNSSVYFGSLIAKKYKIKHIWHLREYNLRYANIGYLKMHFSFSKALICVSNSVFNYFNDLAPMDNYQIIYDGVNIKPYLNSKVPNCDGKNFKLLIAGDIVRNKGQYLAVKAVEYLIKEKKYKLKLFIAGDGKDEFELKKYVLDNSLQNDIIFLGFRNDLDEIRKNINIYLMCSFKEGWGYVTIESILSKNLVIGSNSGGTSEIIKNGINGLLFEPGSIDSLASTIEYAILNWNKCLNIVYNGYNSAIRDYSMDNTLIQINNLYESLFDSTLKDCNQIRK